MKHIFPPLDNGFISLLYSVYGNSKYSLVHMYRWEKLLQINHFGNNTFLSSKGELQNTSNMVQRAKGSLPVRLGCCPGRVFLSSILLPWGAGRAVGALPQRVGMQLTCGLCIITRRIGRPRAGEGAQVFYASWWQDEWESLLLVSLMGKRLLDHGQKVYRHFVEPFPGLLLRKLGAGVGGQEGVCSRTGFKIADWSSVLECPCYMASWWPGAGMKSPVVVYPHQLKKIVLRFGGWANSSFFVVVCPH